MCGRFSLSTPVEEVARLFGVDPPEALDVPPRYNIAPTEPVLAIRVREDGERELARVRWGLVPSWVEDPKDWPTLINARAESLHERPAFREALFLRRCVVPADGFFEWRAERGGKQPYHVVGRNRAPLALAGLWERWHGAGGEPVDSCTVVTTDANALVKPLHDRMPVVLDEAARERWLDPALDDPETLRDLLRPAPEGALLAYPVTRRMNSGEFDDAACVEPLAEPRTDVPEPPTDVAEPRIEAPAPSGSGEAGEPPEGPDQLPLL